MITKPYRILYITGSPVPVLLCLLCDHYSANPDDIGALFCGYCCLWLGTIAEDYRRPNDERVTRKTPAQGQTNER